ncbi:MAG TPA: carbohydrate kinase family protein [Anaerolineales bacterium]|nr:carbohydrate kinase family protein [Anaerolineales bacterium]
MPTTKKIPPAYVGFGMLTPVTIMVLDKLPKHNTGALVREFSEFVFDDAAIIACVLRQWGVPTGMIGTTVGDDPRGHALADQLAEWGVQGTVRFSKDIRTPMEVNVSDKTGARTYFWHRPPEMLATLDTADLSLLDGAQLMYADWYDGEHIVRAMNEANRLHVPVFLNLEHGHKNPNLLKKYASRVSICQAVTDAAQLGTTRAMLDTARKILRSGIKTALVTMAKAGCLVAQDHHAVNVYAPKVKAVDGCGAGATFSAGFIYGYLNGWDMEQSARFATAAASLKVTRAGLQMFPVDEIQALASRLRVQHLRFKDNQFHKITGIISARQRKLVNEGQKLAKIATDRLLPKRKPKEKAVKSVHEARVKRKLT